MLFHEFAPIILAHQLYLLTKEQFRGAIEAKQSNASLSASEVLQVHFDFEPETCRLLSVASSRLAEQGCSTVPEFLNRQQQILELLRAYSVGPQVEPEKQTVPQESNGANDECGVANNLSDVDTLDTFEFDLEQNEIIHREEIGVAAAPPEPQDAFEVIQAYGTIDFGDDDLLEMSGETVAEEPSGWNGGTGWQNGTDRKGANETLDPDGTLVGEIVEEPRVPDGSLAAPPLSLDYFGTVERFPHEWGVGQNSYFFVAKDRETGVKHLVKVARKIRYGDAFLREILILSRLRHPNICPLHFAGLLPTGERFFLQHYLENAKLLSTLREESGSPQDMLPHLVSILADICDVVAYVNAHGVLHRDIKPSNILVWRERGYLIDWGISIYRPELATTSLLGENESLPACNAFAGSPAFMAPEQASADITELDARTDVFMMGATLYFILTGSNPRPSDQDVVLMLEQLRHGMPPIPISNLNPDAPQQLVEICQRSMAFLKDDRYQSALDMKKDLDQWLKVNRQV